MNGVSGNRRAWEETMAPQSLEFIALVVIIVLMAIRAMAWTIA